MNRSNKSRLAPAALLALAVTGCALPKRDAPPPDLEPSVEEPAGKTPEQRYDDAVELMRRNQWAAAQEAFEALAAEVPNASGPWTNLGILHSRAKRWPEARSALQNATRVNASNAAAHNQLGVVLKELRIYAEARNAYETALSLSPDYAAAHLNLGLLLDSHLAEPQQALVHYRRYLNLQGGDDLRVYVWIAEIERRLNAPEGTP